MRLSTRLLAAGMAAAFGAITPAQTQVVGPTPHQTINQVFANLNGRPDVVISLVGTERVGDRVVANDLSLTWHRIGVGSTETLKVSMIKRVAGVVTQEIRADGQTVMAYDFAKRTYSATPYHRAIPGSPGQRDAQYLSRLLSTLVRVSSTAGGEPYVLRLMQEAMGNPAGTASVTNGSAPVFYRSWIPGATPEELPATIPPFTYPDPVVPPKTRGGDVEMGYVPTEKNRYIRYYAATGRSLVFHVYQPEVDSHPSEWVLARIFYGEASTSGNRNRLSEWSLRISYPVVEENDANYELQFAPYTDLRGWRPISVR